MCVYFVYECVACIHVCALWGREELVRAPGIGVTGSCELSCDCWEVQLLCGSNKTSYLLSHLSVQLLPQLMFSFIIIVYMDGWVRVGVRGQV